MTPLLLTLALSCSVIDVWFPGKDRDEDGYEAVEHGGDDCDDEHASIHPGAREIVADGIDQDCDGGDLCYEDGDGDGYGTSTGVKSEDLDCTGTGESEVSSDCDDGNANVHPDADEFCNDQDDDCDGARDEEAVDAPTWYTDADHDGCGDPDTANRACERPYGHVTDGTDCDDTDASIHPGAEEFAYDGKDSDCDGADPCDVDGDGYDADSRHGTGGCSGDDCDDTDVTRHPNAKETAYDGKDSDCDGNDPCDVDGDGYDADSTYGAGGCGGDDCNDRNANVHPDAEEISWDRLDQDCDGADAHEAWDLDEAPYSVVGREGYAEHVGHGLAVCDLDGDRYDDLVVGAPNGNDNHGEVGVFFGSGSAAWSDGMEMSDADVYLTDDGRLIGASVGCADLDGDGWLDLVAGRAESEFPGMHVERFGILGWYGGEDVWSSPPDSPDFELFYDLGVSSTERTDRKFGLGDVYADGASDILVAMTPEENPDISGAPDACGVWVIPGIPGERYSGSSDLQNTVYARYVCEDSSDHPRNPQVAEYGDGTIGLAVGLDRHDGYRGLLGLLSPDPEEGVTADMGSSFHTSIIGTEGSHFGYHAVFDDIDGDRYIDALVAAPFDNTGEGGSGALYFFSDVGSLEGTSLDASEVADVVVVGSDWLQYFTWLGAVSTGDLDGDGYP
ncbi:MAG: putative metal-binding motif-containing protein, partial [Deltaproteobacteria bacterium]|nr:putative metal-binding motif-containing protein [Deltaproteobacteria bacterium]